VRVGERRKRVVLLRPATIRGRVVQLLALPLAIVVALLSLMVFTQVRGYGAAGATARSVGLSLAVQDLVHELQRERGLSVGLLGGATRFRTDLDVQRGRTNRARTDLDQLVGTADAADAAPVRAALTGLVDLPARRADLDAGRAVRGQMFDYYTTAIARLNGLNLGLDRAQDPALRTGLDALTALGLAKEQTGQERATVNGAAAAGRFTTEEYQRFLAIRAVKLSALGQFSRYATAGQQQRLDAALRSGAARTVGDLEQRALASRDAQPLQIDPAAWWSAITALIDQLHSVQQGIGADITARASALRGAAGRDLAALLAVGGALLIGAAVLARSAARAVADPMRTLAREADDLAHRRLPAAVVEIATAEAPPSPPALARVPPHATTEVRQVARALSDLQSSAFVLATEQAATRRTTTEALANLGRRNQDLLRRQLGVITMLEAQEPDPSALGHLFELDHLATRMRRNAESLLILAGETNPRRWTAPLPIADVIRAAVGEVEEYRRVALTRLAPAQLAGPAAADLAHMLAELVENALTFSPADTEVEISGQWVRPGYTISILDRGVGMAGEQLVRANARLAGEESFLGTPGRFVGHYVVGRLAANLGVAVRLGPAPLLGTVARLALPPELLAAPPGTVAGQLTPPRQPATR
jgi:signal transduction histidine kinase